MPTSKSKAKSASKSIAKPAPKTTWASFMESRWSDLYDHPNSEGTSEYETIFLASSGTEGNFGWVPGFLYLITMCMKPLEPFKPQQGPRVLTSTFSLALSIVLNYKQIPNALLKDPRMILPLPTEIMKFMALSGMNYWHSYEPSCSTPRSLQSKTFPNLNILTCGMASRRTVSV